MKCFEGGSDAVVLTHPRQDPSSAILDILKLLKVFTRDPNKESITVVQPTVSGSCPLTSG